ncbi:glycosyltransferase [Acidovorax sp. GBBC 3334]|uniref:nucleotide disphospho-sugar-binding domain-containing protein n=1 Tax=unclassified Acidovorax TaxID=2684926 RepID=UPI002302E38B|nr:MULTISPECIES: glycosyltransferase [unclassified Acidovorax]MDA8455108.1 glycosyltransferase [Acidovorax sp. GBBC 3334]MDA8523486.1 glycosyltransferase [Acidovorax sp. NCPPB 4044]
MARYLLAATALPGHVLPILAVARYLVGLGHEVRVHTGSLFRTRAEATGASFTPLLPGIDHDYRELDQLYPQRLRLPPGPARIAFGLRHFFADAMALQCEGLQRILDSGFDADAIVTDTMFCGTLPLLLGERSARPAIVALGISALALSSTDTAMFGSGLPPPATALQRQQYQALQATVRRTVFGDVQRHFDHVLMQLGRPALPGFFADAMFTLPDLYLQLTAEAFEYPRSDLPATVRFVGPLLAPPSRDFEPPPWWHTLDDGRTVVLVTQGTLANENPHHLIVPTLQALAGMPHLHVIATTGGPVPPEVSAAAPANARVVDFLPYDRLLPKVHVLVTNGGYGSVNHALSLGIPMAVAGSTEEKPEIAARVAWSGAGINLRTGQPGSRAIAEAVHQLLGNPSYRQRARALQEAFAGSDALAEIALALRGLHPAARPTPAAVPALCA